ncbi:MAG: cytochrome C [SAR86 cluster bacterium]|uniref:Cytochrome C n=1 Tax=SAR86 cluster bacterium TaxID=2030880 RepID=A0A2A4WW40_9GAMM|nr:MAG: cytochrome C [SAR86 cluster bacterium]
MIKKALVLVSALAMLVSGSFFTASAQDEPTPALIAAGATDTRQSVFKLLYFNLIPIAGMARGAPFDAEVAEQNARNIAALAPMIPGLFAAADTRDFDVETEALDVIWEDPTGFAAKAQALMEAAGTFADVAAGGDRGATLGAFRALGGGCGNCHDDFRVDTD